MIFLDRLRRGRAAREQQWSAEARREEERRKARSARTKQEAIGKARLQQERWMEYRQACRYWRKSGCSAYFDEIAKHVLAELNALPPEKRSQKRSGEFMFTPAELGLTRIRFHDVHASDYTGKEPLVQAIVWWRIPTGSRIQLGPSPEVIDYHEQYLRQAVAEQGVKRSIRAIMSADGALTIIASATRTIFREDWRKNKGIIDKVFEDALAHPHEEAYETRISATYDDPPDTSPASDSYVFG